MADEKVPCSLQMGYNVLLNISRKDIQKAKEQLTIRSYLNKPLFLIVTSKQLSDQGISYIGINMHYGTVYSYILY